MPGTDLRAANSYVTKGYWHAGRHRYHSAVVRSGEGALNTAIDTAPSFLVRRLSRYATLSNEEKLWLNESLNRRQTLAARAELPRDAIFDRALTTLVDGFACRFHVLPNGRRQITAFLLPGDICDFRFLFADPGYTGILPLKPTVIAVVEQERVVSLCERSPQITQALLKANAVDDAIAREWLTSIGQRSALERTAHLFCELLMRLRAVGLARDLSYELPATQAELGDALGLSAIHINRTLQQLRRENVISYTQGRVKILNPQQLAHIGLFDESYLRLGFTVH